MDLGAAPGGGSQVAAEALRGAGVVVGIDLLSMQPVKGVTLLQGDFCDEQAQAAILAAVERSQVDVVLSDMAPNLTGVRTTDQARAVVLAEKAIDFARNTLTPQGAMLIKVFQGEGFDALYAEFKASFVRVKAKKPKASRPQSTETYLLGRGLR